MVNWLPVFTQGTFTGQGQAAWSVTGNNDYVVYGGEFPRINNTAQQGLVRFARRSISPKAQGPRFTNNQITPDPRADVTHIGARRAGRPASTTTTRR